MCSTSSMYSEEDISQIMDDDSVDGDDSVSDAGENRALANKSKNQKAYTTKITNMMVDRKALNIKNKLKGAIGGLMKV